MHFFEESFLRSSHKKKGLHFSLIRNAGPHYTVPHLLSKTQETPVLHITTNFIYKKNHKNYEEEC